GAHDERFRQSAAFDVVGRYVPGRSYAGMDATIHAAQPNQPFRDDCPRDPAAERRPRSALAAPAGADWVRGCAGRRQRLAIPQTTGVTNISARARLLGREGWYVTVG